MRKEFTKEEFNELIYVDFEVTLSKRQDYGLAIYQDKEDNFWAFDATKDYDWGVEIINYTAQKVVLRKKLVEVKNWVGVDN